MGFARCRQPPHLSNAAGTPTECSLFCSVLNKGVAELCERLVNDLVALGSVLLFVRSVRLSANRSVSQFVCRFVDLSVLSLSVNQSIGLSTCRYVGSLCRSGSVSGMVECWCRVRLYLFLLGQSVCQSVDLSVSWSVSLSVSWSVGASVCPSVGQSVCRSVGLSVCPFVGLSVCQSVGL